MTPSLQFTPPVIAHRGASGYAPENTISAFAKAAQLGCQWIEFDVMLAACKTPIVFHDEDLDRTTNACGPVAGHRYAYLETLDAGKWFSSEYSGEKIPSLHNVMEFIQSHKLCANIELKPLPGQDEITAKKVWHEVSTHYADCLPSILFSSFSLLSLKSLRQLSSNCSIGFLMEDLCTDWEKYCDELECVSINLSDERLTMEKVAKIKKYDVKLLCYTVNTARRAKELFSWGVDAVFSDFPDVIGSCYNITNSRQL